MGNDRVKAADVETNKPQRKSPLEMAKKWTFGRMAMLIKKLGPTNAKRLGQGKLRVRFENTVFSTPREQIEIWKKVMPEGLRDKVMFPHDIVQWPEGFHSALVLTLVGPSAAAELRLYWEILAKIGHIRWNWNNFIVDGDPAPRWWNGYQRESWQLEWQRIDFAADFNSKIAVNDLRNTRGVGHDFPSAGLLAALVVHPKWGDVYRKGYDNDWFSISMDVPGYVVYGQEGSWLEKGGSVSIARDGDEIRIFGGRSDVESANYSIPQFVPFDL